MACKEEHTHIHIHNENKEVVCLLKEIRDLLKSGNGNGDDDAIKQEIMGKLNAIIADVKTTV